MVNVRFIAEKAKAASRRMALLSTEAKNEVLVKMASALKKNKKEILKANSEDVKNAKKKGLSEGLLDRLSLDDARLNGMTKDLLKVAELKDYVGEIIEDRTLPNGLHLERMRVPLGVIGMIYEARPNVTVDAAGLCLKSGNAVILKGGSDALCSNRALARVLKEAASPFDQAIQFIDSADREVMEEFLTLRGLIDVIIPRGGKGLIDFVMQNATVPVIETGASVVHTYVDEFADIRKSVPVLMNAKLRRVSICNTLDTLLIHEKIAEKILTAFAEALIAEKKKLEIRTDQTSFKILQGLKLPKKSGLTIKKAKPEDYHTEWLAPILAVKTVKTMNEAIEHIARYSLRHSEAILTEKKENAERFLQEVDAAAVYWNASTQFSDGAQFGLGAEIGISTQKLHVRGPFALEGLTSYKWVVRGKYHTRACSHIFLQNG